MNKRDIEEYESMLRELDLISKSYQYGLKNNKIAKTIFTENLEKWK